MTKEDTRWVPTGTVAISTKTSDMNLNVQMLLMQLFTASEWMLKFGPLA
jgi:hypothetical protein